ncbi:hypothetical protein B5M47_01305 [candidate division CPR3 bacterium 4484_211]|uniref:ABC-2 type transporter transmembrane domain-containing protein n=1 Tax=candidate division CPR3 bacterium 4484_211 TaxID=1968527 RepID=A0A1W9NYY5_UNCC3|nr:MAG: hypothetical protein B5M47_01305 [candidate division CPR3 bacterium 4484_211]
MMKRSLIAIVKKELAFFLYSPTAYVAVGLFLILVNWLFFQNFFLVNQAEMRDFFQNLVVVYLFLIPALSMASFAEEKRAKTLEVLLTLPLTSGRVVLGKFVGSFLILILALVLTGSVPFTLAALGHPEPGPIVGGYLASLLLGALYLSLGLFVSALSDNQIVSFSLTAVIGFLLYVTGTSFFLDRTPDVIAPLFRFVSFLTHFQNMAKGIIDLRDVVYFVSFTGVLLYLTGKRLNN